MTLDVDSTVINHFGDQEGAELGFNPCYKGRKSHHPIHAFLAEPKMVVNSWIRAGNSASSTEFEEFLENTFEMIPREQISLLRGDNGFCSNRIFNNLEDKGLAYIISAPMKAGLENAILSQRRWLTTTVKGIYVYLITNRVSGWSKSKRIVVVRKDSTVVPQCKGKTLFSEQDDYLRYRYKALATTTSLSNEVLWKTYNQRVDAENQIKELKFEYK